MNTLVKLEGRIFGMPAQLLISLFGDGPEAMRIGNMITNADEILNRRRIVVRQMQIASLIKCSKQSKGNK